MPPSPGKHDPVSDPHETAHEKADEGLDDPRLVAEGELSLARLALDDAELQHAAEHLANAIGADPGLPEAYELLAVLASRPDGGPGLWSLDGEVYVGTAVARAHALAYHGAYSEALGVLASAQDHQPVPPWGDVPWVLDPELPGRLDPDDLVGLFGQLAGIAPDPCPDELRPAMAPYAALARHAATAHPDSAAVLWIASIFLRRLGDAEAAADLAQRSERVEPTDRAAIAYGYAVRSQGKRDEALAAFERALTYNPGNLALHADIAGLLSDDGRLDEAIDWTERALAIDPSHDCSLIARHGLRYERDGDTDELVRLADLLAATESGTHEARHADGELDERSWRWWFAGVPGPTESVINVLEQVLEAGGGEDGGNLTVSAVEPPSALLAFHRAVPGFTVSVTEVLPPDPRQSVPVDQFEGMAAWTYSGTTPAPAFAPPSVEAAEAVARLARSTWAHIPAAYDQAVLFAGTGLDDLLGVLVHPPEPPSGNPADWPAWIRAVQTWACLGIAHHRTDEPWPDSTRRRVLTGLAYGPEDWITEAAVFGLVATAWTDPSTRADVADLVGWRLVSAAQALRTRPVTIVESLALLILAAPAMDSSLTGLARDLVDAPSDEPPSGTSDSQPSATGEEPQPDSQPKRRGLFRRR